MVTDVFQTSEVKYLHQRQSDTELFFLSRVSLLRHEVVSNHLYCNPDETWLTDTVEEGLFLALTGAAIPIHWVHVITFLSLGTKSVGGIT